MARNTLSAGLALVCLALVVSGGCSPKGSAAAVANHAEQVAQAQPPRNQQPQGQRQIQTPFIRSLDEATRAATDIADGDRRTAQQALEEGDRIFARAKLSNREAIRQANRQPVVAGPRMPNVLMMLLPQVAYGDLGCYTGQDRGTPHIDRVAAEGARFNNYFAGSTLPIPSRATLLTGQHPGHARIRGNNPNVPLEAGDVTLAEVLWKAGLATYGIGRWDLGEPGTSGAPNLQGFDLWFGTIGRAQGASVYPATLYRNDTQVPVPANANGKQGEAANSLYAREVETILSAQNRTTRPFFLLVSFADLAASPVVGGRNDRASLVTSLDTQVGRVISALESRGMLDSTVVVITSDAPGGPTIQLAAGAPTIGPAQLRAPLIMRYPRLIGAGAADERLAAHWDLLPTLATLTSAWHIPPGVDGVSLVTQTPTATPARHEMLYWETHEPSFVQTVRDNNWWAVRAGAGPWQLFDLSTDPNLQQNVASSQGQVLTRIDKFARLSHVASPTWRQGPPASRSGG